MDTIKVHYNICVSYAGYLEDLFIYYIYTQLSFSQFWCLKILAQTLKYCTNKYKGIQKISGLKLKRHNLYAFWI